MILKLSLLLSAVAVGLACGLFYSYSVSVNPGLKKLSDTEYLHAMQQINRAILNPVFFSSFMGAVILLPLSAWLSYRSGGADASFYYILAAALAYISGVFGITATCNVPLNNLLDSFNIQTANLTDIAAMRKQFEGPWNRFHLIRTLANLLSFVLLLLGIIKSK